MASNQEKDTLFMTAVYMVLFYAVYLIAGYILLTVGIVQLVIRVLSGKPQPDLQKFGGQLGNYLSYITKYISMRTDCKPYPFTDWPNDQV